jgi:hypothetical protein
MIELILLIVAAVSLVLVLVSWRIGLFTLAKAYLYVKCVNHLEHKAKRDRKELAIRMVLSIPKEELGSLAHYPRAPIDSSGNLYRTLVGSQHYGSYWTWGQILEHWADEFLFRED